MKRPLVLATIFLILGILTRQYVENTAVIALFFSCIALGSLLLRNLYKFNGAFVFILLFVAGFVSFQVNTKPDKSLEPFLGKGCTITGTVLEKNRTASGRYKLEIRVDKVLKGGALHHVKAKVQATMMQDEIVEVSDVITFDGQLSSLEPRKNLGGFDEYSYLRARGISYKTFLYGLEVTGKEEGLRNTLNSISSRISKVYDNVLEHQEAGIMKAMILGDTSGLSEEIQELYRVAGVYHIISISGLHIAMLAIFVEMLLRRIVGRRYSGVLTIFFLVFYTMLTGMAVATVRSTIMYTVIISGDLIRRDSDTLSSTAFAATLLLLYQPLFLWDIGFLYSFAAIAGLACFNREFTESFRSINKNMPKLVIDVFAASIAATLATIPIAAFYFYNFMPYGVLANILIVPASSALVVLGFVVGVVGVFAEPVAIFLAGSVYVILKAYEYICGFFASLPFATILTGSLSLWFIVLWYVALVSYALRKLKIFYTALVVLVSASVIFSFMPKPSEINILSVSEGECIVYADDSYVIVVDGGGKNSYALENFLNYRGIDKVDAYIGLHGKFTEAEGMVSLLAERGLSDIFASEQLYNLNFYAEKYKIPYHELSSGSAFKTGYLEFSTYEKTENELGIKLKVDKWLFDVNNNMAQPVNIENNGGITLTINQDEIKVKKVIN